LFFSVCNAYAALTGTAGLVTINTLALISQDRYRAVARHINPTQPRPNRATVAAAVGVWIYSLSWALAPLLGWGTYVLDGIGTTCSFDYFTRTTGNIAFVLSITVGNFVLPLTVIVFSYSGIWRVSSTQQTHKQANKQTKQVLNSF
jgi:r-opsin